MPVKPPRSFHWSAYRDSYLEDLAVVDALIAVFRRASLELTADIGLLDQDLKLIDYLAPNPENIVRAAGTWFKPPKSAVLVTRSQRYSSAVAVPAAR